MLRRCALSARSASASVRSPPGREVFVILRAVVTDVGHGLHKEVMTRQHKAATVIAALLEPDQGGRLLEEALVLADERFGIRDLFHTDGDDDRR